MLSIYITATKEDDDGVKIYYSVIRRREPNVINDPMMSWKHLWAFQWTCELITIMYVFVRGVT